MVSTMAPAAMLPISSANSASDVKRVMPAAAFTAAGLSFAHVGAVDAFIMDDTVQIARATF
jgi:hypothetical protein